MGSLCSSLRGTSDNDPFTQPGRTVASTPSAARTSKLPAGASRVLNPNANEASSSDSADARRKAAEAAEARAAAASKPGGKLAAQLQEQKKQTRNETLNAASREERALREADSNAEVRNYN